MQSSEGARSVRFTPVAAPLPQAGAGHPPPVQAPPNNLRLESGVAVTIAPRSQPTNLDETMAVLAKNMQEISVIQSQLHENIPQMENIEKKELPEMKQKVSGQSLKVRGLEEKVLELKNKIDKDRKSIYNLGQESQNLVKLAKKMIQDNPKCIQDFVENALHSNDALATQKKLLALSEKVNVELAGKIFDKLMDSNPDLAKRIFDHCDADQANALFKHIEHLPTEKLMIFLPRMAQLEVQRQPSTRFRSNDTIANFQTKACAGELKQMLEPTLRTIIEETIKNPVSLQAQKKAVTDAETDARATWNAVGVASNNYKVALEKSQSATPQNKAAIDKEVADAKTKLDEAESKNKAAEANFQLQKNKMKNEEIKLAHGVLNQIHGAIKSGKLSEPLKDYFREAIKQSENSKVKDGDRQAVSIVFLRFINPILSSPLDQLEIKYDANDTRTGIGIASILQSAATRQPFSDPEIQTTYNQMQAMLDDITKLLT